MSGKSTTINYFEENYSNLERPKFRCVKLLQQIVFITLFISIGLGNNLLAQPERTLTQLLTISNPEAITNLVGLSQVTYQDIESLFPNHLGTTNPIHVEPVTLGEFSLWVQSLDPNLRISLGSRLIPSGRQAFRDLVFLEIAEPFWNHRGLVTGGMVLEVLGRYLMLTEEMEQ